MTFPRNWEDARDVLRKLRDDQIRDGQRVIDAWKVLESYAHRLGDEVWTVQEQVTIAALDCQDSELALHCMQSLELKFPKSLRVKRLRGLYHEAHGRYDDAERVYKEILKDDPTNMFARKREVAILKEKNEIIDAIKKLNEYLELFMTDFDGWMELCDLYVQQQDYVKTLTNLLFMTDFDGWMELCDLYLQQQDYAKAAFCMEELIMSNPHNHLFHQKYAEIKYTEGGANNLETARSYFSQACKLNPNNMRAQYGLLLASSNLVTGHSKPANRQVNTKCAAWAAEQIKDKYQMCQSPEQLKETKVLDAIEKVLESLSTSTS